MKKIVLIDPCRYSRLGIVELINHQMNLYDRVSIAQTDNLVIASAQIRQWQPQLVIADLYPYLIEVQNIRALTSLFHTSPASRLLLYISRSSKFISDYFHQHGAWHILSKRASLVKLETLIELALFSSPASGSNSTPAPRAPLLSPREELILSYWMEGIRNEQIARMLRIQIKTVYTHKRNIRIKLGSSNRLSLYLALYANRIN